MKTVTVFDIKNQRVVSYKANKEYKEGLEDWAFGHLKLAYPETKKEDVWLIFWEEQRLIPYKK